MEENTSFLNLFETKLQEVYKKGEKDFYRSLESFPYGTKYEYDEEKRKLLSYKEVSDRILSILHDPHIQVETNEIILRSELSGKLSYDSFENTLRDPKLWKRKRGAMAPEYVHSIENVDSLDTYENRFICFLIERMDEETDRLLESLLPPSLSLTDLYQTKTLRYGEFSLFRNIEKEKSLLYGEARNEKGSESLLKLARTLKRRLKHLKATEFYKICHKASFLLPVLATNVLLHDPLYSYCYRFYNKNKFEKGGNKEKDILYYDFSVVSILRLLKEEGLLPLASFPRLSFGSDKRLHFSPFKASDKTFSFLFEEDSKELALKIETIYEKAKIHSNTYLLFSETLSEKNAPELEGKRLTKEKECDNVILFTSSNLLREYQRTCPFSYLKEGSELYLRDFFSSLTLLLRVRDDVFEEVCPICGKPHIRNTGESYECASCGAIYVLTKGQEDETLWIKKWGRE